jgi:hypothetical protein
MVSLTAKSGEVSGEGTTTNNSCHYLKRQIHENLSIYFISLVIQFMLFYPWFLLSVNAKTAAYICKAYSFLLAVLLILETNTEHLIAWQIYKVMPFLVI